MTSLSRVMAASGGSDAGRHAAEFAEELARDHQARFRLVNVDPGRITEIEIVRAAESWGADLLVLGRRERSGLGEVLGATLEGVVRRRTGLSLLVPPNARPVDHLVLGLDGTVRGQGILAPAEALARTLHLRVRAIHVARDSMDLPQVERQLLAALARHPGLGGPEILETRVGLPVETILGAVAEDPTGLLVVGVRRGGPPGDAGSGHVGRDLLRRAPTAILTIPI